MTTEEIKIKEKIFRLNAGIYFKFIPEYKIEAAKEDLLEYKYQLENIQWYNKQKKV